MKSYIKTIFKSSLIMAALLGVVSCEDYLDREPESIVSEETAFRNFESFQGYTEEIYSAIPNFTLGYWSSSWNWGDDEILSTSQRHHFIVKVDDGNFWGWQAEHDGWSSGWLDANTPSTAPDARFDKGMWPMAWYSIRKANLGLANLDLLTDATEEERKLIEGQLLFFRGWFHFQLMQYFGGLPYIDRVLPADEQLREPRLSYHETAEKAAADLRRAADLLPIDWDNTVAGRRTLGKNALRANKIMALGFLGKNLLWAASPLMNYESTDSKAYNTDYAQRASTVFGELLALVEGGETQYGLLDFEDYHLNFWTTGQNWALPGGKEAIFRAPYDDGNASNWGISKQYISAVVGEGSEIFAPTANYVNYYGMANGLPLPENIGQADPESGYDPNYPWKGRDPRFYHDIIYDGVKVVQGSMPPDYDPDDRYANLYTGGSYRDVNTGSRSGYLNRKFIPITANRPDQGMGFGANLHIQVPYMRLADIYLMYAEATLMGYGLSESPSSFGKTPVEAVNVLRERAGVEPVNSKFLASVEDFLPELRRERAVELAFEGHRFNDLRRWLLLIEEPYTLKTALLFDRVELDEEDPSLSRVANLREQVVIERNFTEKHYWLPLKVSDVTIYPELNQNPGW